MKKFLLALSSLLVLASVGQYLTTRAAAYPPALGGTGTTTPPLPGQVLIGNGSNTYTPAYILCAGTCTVATSSGGITITGTGVATNTGNWAGTWQLFNPSDFLSSSTVKVTSVNGLSGVVTITSSSLGVVWPTVNGNQAANYNIVPGTGLSSTVSGATTTLSVSLNNGSTQTCSANQFINSVTSSGIVSCGSVTFPTPATYTFSAGNGISLSTATSSSNTTTTITNTGVLSVQSSSQITASAGTGANIQFSLVQAYLTAALQTLNGATSSNQTIVGTNGQINVSTVAGAANSTTTLSLAQSYLTAAIQTLAGISTSSIAVNGSTGLAVSTSSNAITLTNTGVTSFTGQGCVTAANSTGSVALAVSCISGNQTITFTINGDATGTASGATSITDSITVTGLNGKALPANTTGTLQYTSGAWKINLATSSLGVYDSNGNLSSYIGSACGGSQYVSGLSASGTVICGTPAGTGIGPATTTYVGVFNSSGTLIGFSLLTYSSSTGLFTAPTSTFTGQVSAPNIENVLYADQWSGADIGAQINHAVASSTNSPVVVVTASSSYSTPILITANNPLIECAPGVHLSFTGAGTSTAVTFNVNTGTKYEWGMIGCFDQGTGSGNNQIGLVIGGTGGADSITIEGNQFKGFAIGGEGLANTNWANITGNTFNFNNQDWLWVGGSNSGENIRYTANVFADCATTANCVYNSGGYSSVYFGYNSFDDGQFTLGPSGAFNATLDHNHYEPPAALSNANYPAYIPLVISSSSGMEVTETGDVFVSDAQGATSTPVSFIQDCAALTMNGTTFYRNGATTVTNAVDESCYSGSSLTQMGVANLNSAFTHFASSTTTTYPLYGIQSTKEIHSDTVLDAPQVNCTNNCYGNTYNATYNGSVSTPNFTNTGNLATGIYFPNASSVGITASGTKAAIFTNTSTQVFGALLDPNGNLYVTSTPAGATTTTIHNLQNATFTFAGTSNEIAIVTSSPNLITISTPQAIGTGSSPTFAGLTLSSPTASSSIYLNGGGSTTAFAPTFFTLYGGNPNNQSITPKLGATDFFGPVYIATFLNVSRMTVWINTADASATDQYDLGLYDLNGNLVADQGAQSYTGTGEVDKALTQGSHTRVAPGDYYIVVCSGASTTARFGAWPATMGLVSAGQGSNSTVAGACPATSTIPGTTPVANPVIPGFSFTP
jgi:hypothetical protein